MLAVAAHDDPPPGELADPIEALMAQGGQRVSVAGKTLDFWWVKSLPLTSGSNEVSWAAVQEGTLVGAVKLSTSYPDVRGRTMKPGIYTLRYGIEPEEGAHPGVSPSRDLLLVCPAAADNSTSALGHDGAVALAKQAVGGLQPAIWSLDPPVAHGERVGSTTTSDSGRVAVFFSVAVSRDGLDAGVLEFGLTLAGTMQP